MISFRNYEEYLKLKDMDWQDLNELRLARLRAQAEDFLEKRAMKEAINSNKFNKTLETELGKLIQEELNKG